MKRLDVAVGVVVNAKGEVLIAQRPHDAHLGGLWEFPGGKVEVHEGVDQALRRELLEEVGVEVLRSEPLIRLDHDYPDRKVRLHVLKVTAFLGEPQGLENQPVRWVAVSELGHYTFPEANRPIINALKLPPCYAFVNLDKGLGADLDRTLMGLSARGVDLVRLRPLGCEPNDYDDHVARVVDLAQSLNMRLLLSGVPSSRDWARGLGLHLRSDQLGTFSARPIPRDLWLAASCHDARELTLAKHLDVDFVVLGPVQATATHPGAPPLGWDRFQALVEEACMPVYGLGGLDRSHVERARSLGAQGVAAIRGFQG